MAYKIPVILMLPVLFAAACQPATVAAVEPAVMTYTSTAQAVTATPAATPTVPVPTSWKVEEVAQSLEIPWSIVFTSPDRLLVSERPERVREIVDGQLNPDALYTFTDAVTVEETGLMGMVLDPNYSANKTLYACYTSQNDSGMFDRVVRMTDNGDSLTLDGVLLEGIPAAKYHAGCRLGIGPDGKLYVTSGDARVPSSGQDLNSLAGKILRINLDGSIPSDNPFPGSPVYSYGHRNPQGLAWQPGSGRLYATEHGPSGSDGPGGGDEINLIQPGANYGWPLVSHDATLEGTESPLIQFTPAVAPAAAMFYSGDVLPMFDGKFFFGALRGEGVVMVTISTQDPKSIEDVQWIVSDVGRVREVTESPDGLIYFTTSNQDGRGTYRVGGDRVYRIVPVYE
jgi:glucose/arabinose dehydrogenase